MVVSPEHCEGMSWVREDRFKFFSGFLIAAVDIGLYFSAFSIMLPSFVVTYGICALLTLPDIHKKEILCQFKTLSAPSAVQVLWSKQQRRNEPIYSCI